MNTFKIMTVSEAGGENYLGPDLYVPYAFEDSAILECDLRDERRVGFILADHYRDLIVRRLAAFADIAEEIAREVLDHGVHKGEALCLELDGNACEIKIETRDGEMRDALPLFLGLPASDDAKGKGKDSREEVAA